MSEKLTATVEFERILRIEGVDRFAYVPQEVEQEITERHKAGGNIEGMAERAYEENNWTMCRDGECELWIVLPGKVTINVAKAALNDQIAMWAQRLCDTPDERVNEATTCMEEIRRLVALMEKETT